MTAQINAELKLRKEMANNTSRKMRLQIEAIEEFDEPEFSPTPAKSKADRAAANLRLSSQRNSKLNPIQDLEKIIQNQ